VSIFIKVAKQISMSIFTNPDLSASNIIAVSSASKI